MKFPRLILIIDGMGDRPTKELENKTPLQAAKTPNMDKLALNRKTVETFVFGRRMVGTKYGKIALNQQKQW